MIIWTKKKFSFGEKTGLGDDNRNSWLLSVTFAECLRAPLDRDK